jgi:hypothetical protein
VAAKRKDSNGFVYRSYSFVDKDPVIDEVRTIVQQAGLLRKKGGLQQLYALSGVASSTTHNWFFGSTKKPNNATIEAVARSLGFRRKFERFKDIDLDRELARVAKQQASE